jgi:hypothetical protein
MMRRFALAGVVLFALAAASPVRAAQEVPGRLVVELTDAGARALHAGTLRLPLPPGGEAMHPRIEPLFTSRTGPLARFALVTFDPPVGADASALNREWLESFGRSSTVTRGGPDYVMPMAALPDDPYLLGAPGQPRQFQLHNTSGLSERFARAWPFVPADREVIVGVIDSGVTWRHPDLGGGGSPPDARVFWRNALEVNGIAGADDDGNGKVDDFIGWDFVEVSDIGVSLGQSAPVPGEDGHVADNDPSDYAGHGSQVAGFINALTGNAVGIAGAAPPARIMVLRVGWLSSVGSVVYMTFCAQAIEYAALNGARVLNCSWDSIGDAQYGLAAALDVAINTYGVVVVGSAGNSSTSSTTFQYLASREDCLGVAGVLESGVKAGGSNYGAWVDLAGFYQGPVTTTYFYGTSQPGYSTPSGTSFASPQVAAAAALVRGVAPQASASSARAWLKATGRSVAAMNPSYTTLLGSGLVDAAAAVQAAAGGWDAEAHARAVTPYAAGNPETAPNFLYVGPTSLKALATATGTPAPDLIDSVATAPDAAANLPLVVAWPGLSAPMAVWREGTSLRGVPLAGIAPAGWPVAIDADAGQPAANPSATEPEIFVPSAQGLLIVRYNGAADPVTEMLPFACSSVAVGSIDSVGPADVAAVDSAGALHIYLRDGEGGTTRWDDAPGLNPLPPVITSGGTVLVACSDPSTPSTLQWLRRYQVSGVGSVPVFLMDGVSIEAPPFTALSAAGFASDQRWVAVAADSAGGIHVVEPETEVVQSVSAGGPIAGEVLCADLDGDWESDLIALRRDGTLCAWRSDLSPLAGFPRQFPFGATETPMVADAEGVRYVVVADTAGGLWSLPTGPADRPAPWPTARGDASRRAYFSLDRATPVEPGVSSLEWDWKDIGGVLCWLGEGLDTYVQLRVRDVESEDVIWSGSPRDSRCLRIESINAACTLAVDGLHRTDGWRVLRSLEIGPPGLRVAAPEPNPSLSGTHIAWSGASGAVRVAILDVRGRVTREADFSEPEGAFFWDGNDGRGRPAPGGIYFARVSDAARSVARRFVRLR